MTLHPAAHATTMPKVEPKALQPDNETYWQTSSDVRALTEAQEVHQDPQRLVNAQALLAQRSEAAAAALKEVNKAVKKAT